MSTSIVDSLPTFRAVVDAWGDDLADLAPHSLRRRVEMVRRMHSRLRQHPAWGVTMVYAAHWGAGDRRLAWRLLDRAIAVQPDVRSGRRRVDDAEVLVLSAPDHRPSQEVPYDPVWLPSPARRIPATSQSTLDALILHGADLILKVLGEAPGAPVITDAARHEIVTAWQQLAERLAARPCVDLSALADNGRSGWARIGRIYRDAVPLRPGQRREHGQAVKKAIVGTEGRPGPLIWLARDCPPLGQHSPKVLVSWASAATMADPAVHRLDRPDTVRRTAQKRAERAVRPLDVQAAPYIEVDPYIAMRRRIAS